MRTAGLYLRISKDRTGEGLAIDRQRGDGTRLITQRGWKLLGEYIDNDISAAGRRRRPGFEQLLRDVTAGRVNVIVALSLDRLTRNRRDQLRLIEVCQEHAVLVALVRGSDIDMSSAVGRAMADMMAVWARMEIEQKSERHISQIAQAADKGLIVGAPRPFGYAPGGMHLDPDEAPLVRAMYDRWLTGGELAPIRRWLNDAGVRTARGNVWQNHTVREVLANPRNAALRGMRDVVNPRTGTRSQWHRIIGPAVWPAIVSEETWRAAMAQIRDPGRPGNHRGIYSDRHLLTGIALCGVCGDRLVAGRRDGVALLCCSTFHLSRRASYIEAFVVERLMLRLGSPEGRVLMLGGRCGADADLDAVRSRSVELRARLKGLAADYADGLLDREGLRVAGDRLRAQLTDLDGEIASAGRVNVVDGLVASADHEEEWDSYSKSLQREVIRQVMTVTVLSGKAGRPKGLRFDPASVVVGWLHT